MPRNAFSSYKRRKYFVFFVLAAALVVYLLLITSVSASFITIGSINVSNSSLELKDKTIDIDYMSLMMDSTLNASSIFLNGALTPVVELPIDSTAIILPDDRLAIQLPEQISLLPEGSILLYCEEKPFIRVPYQTKLIEVSSVVVSPLKNFLIKTNVIQSVQELDVYNVEVVFFELARENPGVALVDYTINWGDGIEENYTADTIAVSHQYNKSGTYSLTIQTSDELGFVYISTQYFIVNFEGHLTHSYLWVDKNKAPIMTASLSFGLFAVGFFALTESGRYKLLFLFTLLLPFYSQSQREDVLDQFVRGQIYGFIKTNPGAHYNQIMRNVGVKNGTLSYHLGVLEKTELIQSRREGLKYRAFYPTGMNFPKAERFRLTDLQIQIIDAICEKPGLTQKEIARLLNRKPQTINYNIKVLDQANLVSVAKTGRKTTCFPVSNTYNSE